MPLAQIRQSFAYNRWANARLLRAASELSAEAFERDLGTSFQSVRGTFAHMLGAEWIWLERLHGESPREMPDLTGLRSAADLGGRWAQVQTGQADLLAELSASRLNDAIAYTNTRGEPHRYLLGAVLYHIVNHASYHRGQVAAMIRQLGGQPVATDFVRFLDEVPSDGDPVER